MGNKFSEFKSFFNKYSEYFYVLILGIFCFLFLFLNLGNYPLIDIDETRYTQIAKEMFNSGNYIIPYLNYEPFLEKPPLYFWITSIFFGVFHSYSIFIMRFGNTLMALFTVFFTYFTARKILNKKYALTSAIILLSSLWFLLFSHIAILDMGFTAMTSATIFSAILSLYTKDENKKYCWWCFWIFMGLSALAKGLIGIIIPMCVIFLIFLIKRKLKEIVKPANFIPGFILFCLVCGIWHVMAWQQGGMTWLFEYFLKHHFARFFNSGMGLGRKQPFLFYVPIILIGIFPWVLQLLIAIGRIIKHAYKELTRTKSVISIFSSDTPEHEVIMYSSIWSLFIFLMFSISSTKLPTYVLPLFPPTALLCGYIWYEYILGDKYEKQIKITSYIFFGFILLVGIVAFFLPFIQIKSLVDYISGANFIALSSILFVIISVFGIIFTTKNRRLALFLCYVALSLSIITIATTSIFKFITTFGQNELMQYADFAKQEDGANLTTFDFPHKYSVVEEYGKKVNIIEEYEIEKLETIIKNGKENKIKTLVIVKNKNFNNYNNFPKYETIQKGKKYTLIEF